MRGTNARLSNRSLVAAALIVAFVAATALLSPHAVATTQRKGAKRAATQTSSSAGAKSAQKVLTVRTAPKAVVWLDELRRGTADESGTLAIKNVSPGAHTLRVRARGFRERTLPVAASQRGTLDVRLTPTTDEAELAFQEAEELAEKGGESRARAVELYRRALTLRPRFPAAHLGLARALSAANDFDAALEEIAQARRDRPNFAEASAVEGRILRELAEYDEALHAFRRAIREGRGIQPEAHTGLGLLHVDQGDHASAVESFRKAVAQLSDTEPTLYQLLGASYEKLEKWKEALAAYEKYLELAPDGKLAPAIRSIIDQLRQQASEQQ
jgi:Flp pilus assembly protein TadD